MGDNLLNLTPVSLDASPAVCSTSTEMADALLTRIDKLHTEVDDTISKAEKAREDELNSLDPGDRDTAKKLDAQIYSGLRRKTLREVQEREKEGFEKHLADLNAQKAKLESLRELLGPTSAHYATTLAVSQDPAKLASYATITADAQPGVVAQLIRQAVASKDVALAAAVCNRLSEIDKKYRPASPQEVADAVVGDDYARRTKAIAEALDRVEDGRQAAAAWMSGRKISGVSKIERGLRQQARANEDSMRAALEERAAKR